MEIMKQRKKFDFADLSSQGMLAKEEEIDAGGAAEVQGPAQQPAAATEMACCGSWRRLLGGEVGWGRERRCWILEKTWRRLLGAGAGDSVRV